MVSSVPTYEDELSNSAHANISLIADRAWTFDREDPFHKLNYSLWIQYCKVTAKYKEDESFRSKRVRDVIPDSHLARYGNYEYNYERESLYRPDSDSARQSSPSFCWTEVTEPWMLPEVEEHFARIISKPRANQQNRSSNQQSNAGAGYEQAAAPKADENRHRLSRSILPGNTYNYHRYSIDSSAEVELHARVTCSAVRDLWNPAKLRQIAQRNAQYSQKHAQAQSACREQSISTKLQQQRLYCSFEYPVVYSESYGVARKPLAPILSPEVPEFFPKVATTTTSSTFTPAKEQSAAGSRLQYFPSLNERSYQHELFPYNRPHEYPAIYQSTTLSMVPGEASGFARAPQQQWFQKVVPPPTMQIQISVPSTSSPVYTSVQPLRAPSVMTQRPLRVQGKFFPTTSGHLSPTPIPVYQRPIELYHETQRKKNQGVDFKNLILLTKNVMKCHRSNRAKSSQKKPVCLLEAKKTAVSLESNVLVWQEKVRASKAAESEASISETQTLKEKTDCQRSSSTWKELDESAKMFDAIQAGSEMPAKGGGKVSSKSQEDSDNLCGKRLYRDVLANTSVNEPVDNVFEKRYDELEQQAMEQYRNSEESLALKYQELEQQAMEQYKSSSNPQELSSPCASTLEKQAECEMKSQVQSGCSDGRKCSGLGGCSPVKQIEKTEGSFSQVTLLKSESKSQTNVSSRSAPSRGGRPTVLSKSLTTLAQNVTFDSKNLCRGASARASPKSSRLILMSPFEQRSEAKLAKNSRTSEIYCVAQKSRNGYRYYDDAKIDRKKDVDENVTIIQSPRTEVWLSGFWTT